MEKSAICENKSFRKNCVLWRNIIDISFTTNLVTSMYERRDCAPVMEKLQFEKFCILTVRLELWFFCFVFFFSWLTKWSSLELQSSPFTSKAVPPLPQLEGVGAVPLLAQLEGEGENPRHSKEEVHQKCKKNRILIVRLELCFFLHFVFFSVDSPSDQVLNCSILPSPPKLSPHRPNSKEHVLSPFLLN